MNASRLKGDRHGFALVDVLVALVVASLAGSILVGLFAFIERSAHRTKELAQVDQGVSSISRILRHLTEETYSVRTNKAGTVLPHGTERAFVIATTGPRILGFSQPTLFMLKCETVGEKTRIVLQWNDPNTGQEYAEVAGEPMEQASFSYFGRKDASGERSWQPTWHEESGRLEAIKMTLHSRNMPAPIELVAPLRADLAVQCTRNPHQPGCHFRED